MGQKQKHTPPTAEYPPTPRIVGLDWLELPVRRPTVSAQLYEAIGLSCRGMTGSHPRLAVGGIEFLLRRSTSATTNGTRPPTGVRIQLAVDDVEQKREQLKGLGLKPSPIKRQPRGDWAFEWRDPDGHRFRFVGPGQRQAS